MKYSLNIITTYLAAYSLFLNYRPYVVTIMSALCLAISLPAQMSTQRIYGSITDKGNGEALIGASVVILNSDPIIGTITDLEGNYVLDAVPVGQVKIRASYLGYNNVDLPEMIISSGKSLQLDIKLEEALNNLSEVVVKGRKLATSNLSVSNEMATVSAISFNIEQSNRFAGSLSDPSRVALSFPGVRNQGDIQNGISVRGNTPSSLLWCIEGLEIQSPNHYAREGAQGAVNMLNSNLLQGVDFFTAAFPAQYGNAGSGVFDLKIRKGNPEDYEFSVSAGTLGLEASAEGPFSKKNQSSFLFSYRYSTLGLLSAVGYNIGGNALPSFQDFNYKLNFQTKKLGVFQAYGFLGDSKIRAKDILTSDGDWSDNYRLGMIAINNGKRLNDKTFLNSTLMYSQSKGAFYNQGERNRYNYDNLVPEYRGVTIWKQEFPVVERRLQFDLKSSTKLSAKHSMQCGVNFTYIQMNQEFRTSDLISLLSDKKVAFLGATFYF